MSAKYIPIDASSDEEAAGAAAGAAAAAAAEDQHDNENEHAECTPVLDESIGADVETGDVGNKIEESIATKGDNRSLDESDTRLEDSNEISAIPRQAWRRMSNEEIDSMSVKELRALITKAGLSFADCVEKSDLRARAREAAAKGGASVAAIESEPTADTLKRAVRAARTANPAMGKKKLIGLVKRENPMLGVSTKKLTLALDELDARISAQMNEPATEATSDQLMRVVQAARTANPNKNTRKLAGIIKRENPTLGVSTKQLALVLDEVDAKILDENLMRTKKKHTEKSKEHAPETEGSLRLHTLARSRTHMSKGLRIKELFFSKDAAEVKLCLSQLGAVTGAVADTWTDWAVVVHWYMNGDTNWARIGLAINLISGVLSALVLWIPHLATRRKSTDSMPNEEFDLDVLSSVGESNFSFSTNLIFGAAGLLPLCFVLSSCDDCDNHQHSVANADRAQSAHLVIATAELLFEAVPQSILQCVPTIVWDLTCHHCSGSDALAEPMSACLMVDSTRRRRTSATSFRSRFFSRCLAQGPWPSALKRSSGVKSTVGGFPAIRHTVRRRCYCVLHKRRH